MQNQSSSQINTTAAAINKRSYNVQKRRTFWYYSMNYMGEKSFIAGHIIYDLYSFFEGEYTKSQLIIDLQCMLMKPKSTCHILLITSIRTGHQRLREDQQHPFMMTCYNDVKNNVSVVQYRCLVFISLYQVEVQYNLVFMIIYSQNL